MVMTMMISSSVKPDEFWILDFGFWITEVGVLAKRTVRARPIQNPNLPRDEVASPAKKIQNRLRCILNFILYGYRVSTCDDCILSGNIWPFAMRRKHCP